MKHYDPLFPKPEIVIGLAGPAGTDLQSLASEVADAIRPYGYQSFQIRVSSLIQAVCSKPVSDEITKSKFERRVELLMAAADFLRRKVKSGAATVPLITTEIRSLRQGFLLKEGCDLDYEDLELYNHCYILNSLKHPDEVDLLRHIYGDKFIMISAFTHESERKTYLTRQIAKSYKTTNDAKFLESADRLISLDRKRPGEKIGQNLSETFHLADFFLSMHGDFQSRLDGFFQNIFSYPYATPTRCEMHMFQASSIALKSADLSRQIGAVIANAQGDAVAQGCNEVPLPGGGSFWIDDVGKRDNRDFTTGRDFNAVKKIDIIEELIKFLAEKDVNVLNLPSDQIDAFVTNLIFGNLKSRFKDLRVSNLIEFGRVVHAEMHALSEAARRGLAVGGGTIYTTTFPCHMCARHIISSGIENVVYIEPYPKSMTKELYPEDVSIDEESSSKDKSKKVVFRPFEGVSPRRFRDIFSSTKRKTSAGYIVEWTKDRALPKFTSLSTAHLSVEAIVASQLKILGMIDDIKDLENV
ncbi:deaminase [Sphingopyxis sp. MWB1]|uniref:deaminase n=1 Tax=Sphingopyxis sp. MWB1 TaxID=1537715 RepID=UPI0013627CCB|nr:deaminase [Sphingopyxis sp. MWB1]